MVELFPCDPVESFFLAINKYFFLILHLIYTQYFLCGFSSSRETIRFHSSVELFSVESYGIIYRLFIFLSRYISAFFVKFWNNKIWFLNYLSLFCLCVTDPLGVSISRVFLFLVWLQVLQLFV